MAAARMGEHDFRNDYARPMRRTDFPALEELVRQAWYVDDESDDNGNVPNDERGLRKYSCARRFTCVICIDSRPSTCMIFFPAPPRLRSLNVMVGCLAWYWAR